MDIDRALLRALCTAVGRFGNPRSDAQPAGGSVRAEAAVRDFSGYRRTQARPGFSLRPWAEAAVVVALAYGRGAHLTAFVIRAGPAYFARVFGVGFVPGALRVAFLVPRLSERIAELDEMPLMSLAILLAARFVIRHFALLLSMRAHLGTRLPTLVLLPAVSGSVNLATLMSFALMPAFVGKELAPGIRTPERTIPLLQLQTKKERKKSREAPAALPGLIAHLVARCAAATGPSTGCCR